ncbi:hypothetical protein NLX86_15465 [Streptomyces sp. A3M-1-3]|uniref:hypothetical protein n=1 Tax=Streptomyces sp. A3M-1-3 TaxID=2962044 RepID=UPI0020B73C24|nr:hypothetical protein [Streptomyces sp. A3M-1-3]MCP3819453.1 hypothetical protein [Streptomyces sp. A3M-1-3]
MPRPTAAQLAYGSATVIASTIVMLLLSQTSTGLGVAVISAAALALGVVVAVIVPAPKKTARTVRSNRASVPSGAPAARVPEPEHSLHR